MNKVIKTAEEANQLLLEDIDNLTTRIEKLSSIFKEASMTNKAENLSSAMNDLEPDSEEWQKIEKKLDTLKTEEYKDLVTVFQNIERVMQAFPEREIAPRVTKSYTYLNKLENSIESLEGFATFSRNLKNDLG